MFDRILIIGLGFMGGSMAKAIKKHGISEKIYGYDNNQEAIKYALENKIIDEEWDSKTIDFDLEIHACEMNYDEDFKRKHLVISLSSVMGENENILYCHPLCGSEKSGIKNSIDDLFLNRRVFMNDDCTPIIKFFEAIGMMPYLIEAELHNEILALTSHFPHYLTFKYNLKNRLLNSNREWWNIIFEKQKKYIEKLEADFDLLYKNTKSIQEAFKEMALTEFKKFDDNKLTNFYGNAYHFCGNAYYDFIKEENKIEIK
jgi:prephenate dehydrogenase